MPLRVITFNVAAGNPEVKTGERAFLGLPFYREVMDGRPQAAILALQEVGPEQARALKRAAARGRFTVIQVRRPRQGNALLVPARFELLDRRSRYFAWSQLVALVRAAWRAATGAQPLDHRQHLELRMWTEARLRDDRAGRMFTVFNTHLSGDSSLRLAQARALLRRVHAARRHGPVILTGDLNTRPAGGVDLAGGADADRIRADAAVWALCAPLEDMAPAARDPRRAAVDHVLATGLVPVGARQYTDDSIKLPGLPTAELISDHYAKEVVLRFA